MSHSKPYESDFEVFKFAGKVRDYDITKKEWVLNGDTVIYGAAFELKSALEYDFEQERKFSYKNISDDEIVRHIAFSYRVCGRYMHLEKATQERLRFLQ